MELIGSKRAAKILGVDRATFNRWVQAGQIPVEFKVEGQTGARLFDADVIEQLANERAVSEPESVA